MKAMLSSLQKFFIVYRTTTWLPKIREKIERKYSIAWYVCTVTDFTNIHKVHVAVLSTILHIFSIEKFVRENYLALGKSFLETLSTYNIRNQVILFLFTYLFHCLITLY